MCCGLRRPRPQKCRAGVAVRVSPPTLVDSCQSSSRSRSAGTPQCSRWAPTPSGTAKAASGAGQALDRGHVEVVVVVVGDHHDVDRAQRGQRQRAPGAAAWVRRRRTANSARPRPGRRAPAARRSRRARWSAPSRSAAARRRAAPSPPRRSGGTPESGRPAPGAAAPPDSAGYAPSAARSRGAAAWSPRDCGTGRPRTVATCASWPAALRWARRRKLRGAARRVECDGVWNRSRHLHGRGSREVNGPHERRVPVRRVTRRRRTVSAPRHPDTPHHHPQRQTARPAVTFRSGV